MDESPNSDVVETMELIAIGQVTKSVGVRGEMAVKLLTDDPERFFRVKHVAVGQDAQDVMLFDVEQTRKEQRRIILKLKGVDSPEEVENLRSKYLYVKEEERVTLPEGSYFIHEVVGMNVVAENGIPLGTVEDVWQLPANDVWVVRYEGREVLLPATKEVIRGVDRERKTVVIFPMEGIFE